MSGAALATLSTYGVMTLGPNLAPAAARALVAQGLASPVHETRGDRRVLVAVRITPAGRAALAAV